MSELPARMEIVTDDGIASRAFLGLWAASGALRGLPAPLLLVMPSGAPTPGFWALLKAAFPSIDIAPTDTIVSGRIPTRRFLAAWARATA